MRLLLDSHALVWAVDDPGKLGSAASFACNDPSHVLEVSMATVWELSIKHALGKLLFTVPFRRWIEEAVSALSIVPLPIRLEHIHRQTELPWHHRDPFDRLLVAQALVEDVPIVSADPIFDAYGVRRWWS